MVSKLALSDFDFDLPQELIAQKPVEPRDGSRLLKVANGSFAAHKFLDILDYLQPGDVLVLNDTKVIPAQLKGWKLNKLGVKTFVNANLHKENNGLWYAFVKPARKVNIGDTITFGDGFSAEVASKAGGEVAFRFNRTGYDFYEALELYGSMPLPQYIKRDGRELQDNSSYQTVFAKNEGAVAAPTAGLHFTKNILNAIALKGIEVVYLTLHVGAGTFLPVKVEDISQHKMHFEWFEVSDEAALAINNAKRVIAVGTTSLRALESAASDDGNVNAYKGETGIFITPGYKFKVVDILVTNFHLPKSTLFMLVAAFTGLAEIKKAYHYAIREGFRFFSYGDSCWLERNDGK